MLLVLSAVGGWALYTATGVGGAALAWISLRLNGALVWKTNAEGYKAELERVKTESALEVAKLVNKNVMLEFRIQELEHKVLNMDTSAMAAKIAAELASLTVHTAAQLEQARSAREDHP